MNIIITKRSLRTVQALFLFVLAFAVFARSASALTITPIKLELQADPGQIIKQEITLYNETDTAETLYVSYSNFEANGETGQPVLTDAKDDLGTWMQAAAKVSIASKSSQIVPVTINVPADATPGGHFAGIFWGTTPPGANGSEVSIGYKTGVLVLLSVKGDVSENGGIIEYNTKDHSKFYTSLPIAFYYRFQNLGGDRVKPTGDIIIKNMIGFVSARVPGNPVDGNVLPSSTRRIETFWQGKDGATPVADADQGNFLTKTGREWRNFAFGYYRANISLAYGTKNQVTTGSIGFWIFPWHLTLFVVIVGLILFFILRKLIRHYNTWVIGRAEEIIKRENARTAKKRV